MWAHRKQSTVGVFHPSIGAFPSGSLGIEPTTLCVLAGIQASPFTHTNTAETQVQFGTNQRIARSSGIATFLCDTSWMMIYYIGGNENEGKRLWIKNISCPLRNSAGSVTAEELGHTFYPWCENKVLGGWGEFKWKSETLIETSDAAEEAGKRRKWHFSLPLQLTVNWISWSCVMQVAMTTADIFYVLYHKPLWSKHLGSSTTRLSTSCM